jgi:iron complex outermembrane receptor protein
VFGVNAIPVRSTTRRVDPKVALQYQWTEDFMTYAQYSTGFKGGGTNPNPINAAQALPFGVEALKAYEVGAKSALFAHRLAINAATYYNDVKGLQLVGFGQTSAGGTTVQNAGEAQIEGAELEIQVHAVRSFLISAAADYMHFHYKSLGAAVYDPVNNPGGLLGNDVAPYSPKWKGNLGAQFDITCGAAGTLTPRVDASYQSRVYFDPQNLLASSQGGYATLNGHLIWHHPAGKLSVIVDVNNATNKLYYESMFNQLRSFGILTGQPAEPRKVLASVKYEF